MVYRIPRTLRGNRGFSLIELMVVVIILGILAMYIGPKLMGRTEQAKEVQTRVQIEGLETAEILRHGYAVEYDVVAPRQVAASLECDVLPGLYLAGQLLGTSGYEEAAALGLLAGINAVSTAAAKTK